MTHRTLPRRVKSREDIQLDFQNSLKVSNLEKFIADHTKQFHDSIKKLRDSYKEYSEEEYQAAVQELADKLLKDLGEVAPQTLKNTVETVEKEEKKQFKERQSQSNAGPVTPGDPSAASNTSQPGPSTAPVSGDQGPAPPHSTGQQGSSAPENQNVPPPSGNTPAPIPGSTGSPNPNTQSGPNNLGRSQTNSTQQSFDFSHAGSEVTDGTSIYGDEGAQGPNGPFFPPQAQLTAELQQSVGTFVSQNFKGLIQPDDPEFLEMMKRSAQTIPNIRREYDLTPEEARELPKLALYDFVILCDDSWSMMPDENEEGEDRVTPLKATLGRLSTIATQIEPSGISIRFLNYTDDSTGWDNLKDNESIENKWNSMKGTWGGITQLGAKLNQKIIQPMVFEKMQMGKFKKPLIVVIITDGSPTGESQHAFKDAVIGCKQSKEVASYGEAVVVFIISRVGSDKYAERFLNGLQSDKELKEWVYCKKGQLPDEKSAIMKRAAAAAKAQRNKSYTKNLLQVFIAALKQQTS
ncbi:hypothetical protein TWF481_001143 [Arthrobotrys musiformis]|uniref:VWFA domain-containing protein n=1 Tax=Arthrobotrys musiformis TaxID=47236 RepID=A0AAV9WPN6_9PEZI